MPASITQSFSLLTQLNPRQRQEIGIVIVSTIAVVVVVIIVVTTITTTIIFTARGM